MDDSNLSAVEHQLTLQLDLEDVLAKTDSNNNNAKNFVISYLNNIQKSPIKIKDDFKGFKWLNVSKALSLENDLQGLITLCDFFTYCCINCLHILPFLHKIEQKYSSKEVLVLGVHSPKFENEKSLQNVANAIIRHDIVHPVCNDPELKLWNQLSINCWPTISIISPNGELLFLLIGENSIQSKLEFYTEICLEYFSQELKFEKKQSIPMFLLKNHQKDKNDLNYPTKISLSSDEMRLSIANTLHHSVIVSNIFGIVEFTIGSKAGFQDGSFEQVMFNYPQGMAWTDSHTFYICDTENNAIRKVDLITKTVITVANQLNSPWDLIFNPIQNRLYCAMAGAHQIWTMVLSEQGDTIHDVFYPRESMVCFAGDGNEQKRNHRHLLKSSFAQPSGLAIKSDVIYVADSESSSVRAIDLKSNSVSTLIGGSPDPLDLFAFGDIDGIGSKCRLQHCMGLCSSPNEDVLFLCDTFNHKIKKIDIKTKKCETLNIFWDNVQGAKNLNEPNGICFVEKQNTLLIADTNNHRIISIDLNQDLNASNFYLLDSTNDVSSFKNCIEETDSSTNKTNDNHNSILFVQDELMLSKDQELNILIKFKFTGEIQANSETRHKISCITDNELLAIDPKSLLVKDLNNEIRFVIKCLEKTKNQTNLSFKCDLNLCNYGENLCTFKCCIIQQPILINNDQMSHSKDLFLEKFIKIEL